MIGSYLPMGKKNYIEYFRCTEDEIKRISTEMKALGLTIKSEYYRYKIFKQEETIKNARKTIRSRSRAK